jgi:hypothetical protein
MMIQTGDNYLFELICNACSQNPVNVKEAETKLQEAEKQPGYCLSLLVNCFFFYNKPKPCVCKSFDFLTLASFFFFVDFNKVSA